MDTLGIGSQIGPYRLDGLLGKGGMAEVWKAWHHNLHRHEALKALPAQMAFDKNFVARFLREARTAAGLQHPNIAVIHAVSEADCPLPYFSMELLQGGDLADLLELRGRLAVEEALPLLRQIGSALDYAHGRGVIHRDIKPGNLMLVKENDGSHTVKVVDFGIARAQEDSSGTRLTQAGMIVGTPDYMSPEQGGNAQGVDYRTDIYSLGVIAFEMLCGRPPFQSSSAASSIAVIMDHMRTPPPDPRSLNPLLSRSTALALLAALAKEPENRPQSCAEFTAMLQGDRGTGPGPGPKSRKVPASTWVGLLLVAGCGFVAYGLQQGTGPGGSGTGGTGTGATRTSGPGPDGTGSGSQPHIENVASLPPVKVPALLGMNKDDAVKRAGGVGLEVTVIGTGNSDSIAPGLVMGQSPSAGTLLAAPSSIQVRMSAGQSEAQKLAEQKKRAMYGELTAAVEAWRQGWESSDVDGFMTLYADEIKLDGRWKSKAFNRNYHATENMDQPYRTITTSNVRIVPMGEDKGRAELTQEFSALNSAQVLDYKSRGHTTLTFMRQSGGWKIVGEEFHKEWSHDF